MAPRNIMEITSSHCRIHPGFVICVKVEGSPWELEVIEGAFLAYLQATDCTVCAAESRGLSMDDYIGIFVEQFLPLISDAKSLEASGRIIINPNDISPRLSYG